MNKLFKIFFAFTLLLAASTVNVSSVSAQTSTENSDSIDWNSVQVSILTASPGPVSYELFGHTAIRVRVPERNIDYAYNYGTFSFEEDNFIFRFLKGETDYMLGIVPWDFFSYEYFNRGSSLTEQVLNLTEDELRKLVCALEINSRKENRVYRYNYFYSNCTTRARDIIENNLNGYVEYKPVYNNMSYRRIVQGFTAGSPWVRLGIDFCLGAEADIPIEQREQMFIPSYLEKMAVTAEIVDSLTGNSRPLVQQTNIILRENPGTRKMIDTPQFPSPLLVFWGLFVIVLIVSCIEYSRKKIFLVIDTLLLLVQGVVGVIVFLLFFFSEHPTVNSNWLILVFNPLPLLWIPVNIYMTLKRKKEIIHFANLLVILLFLAFMPLIPQIINVSVYPFLLTLCLRSLLHLLVRNSGYDVAHNLFKINHNNK